MNELTPMNQPLDRIRSDIDRTFNRWLSHWGWPTSGAINAPTTFGLSGPVVDLEETDKEVTVTAEMPGLSKDDFKVELEGQRLVLRGEKKSDHEEKHGGTYYSERSYGSFMRAIDLPAEVDPAKVSAQYKDGVLRITLPKSESAKTKAIDVKVA